MPAAPQYFIDPSEIDGIDQIDALRIGYTLLHAMNVKDVFVREISANAVLRAAACLVGDNCTRGTLLPDAYRSESMKSGISPFAPARSLEARRSPSGGLALRLRRNV